MPKLPPHLKAKKATLKSTLSPKMKKRALGNDGNAFYILGKVKRAMEGVGVPVKEVKAFLEEAKSGDYDHLLQTCMKWVTVY